MKTNKLMTTLALSLAISSAPIVSVSSRAAEQSFDCTHTSESGEQAVCKSDVLMKFDHAILKHHDAMVGKMGQGRADALMNKFQQQRKKCFGDASCILKASQDAISIFHQAGSPLDKSGDPEVK